MLANKVQHKCGSATCNKPAPKRCSRCHQVYYCSKKCQRSHWKSNHKKECKDLKAQYVIYQTLTSIKAHVIHQMPTSILLQISEYALGAIEDCQQCEQEILKLNRESEKYTRAMNGLFCTPCKTNNDLDLCECHEMKPRSKLTECVNCYERWLCDSDTHKKCARDLCPNAICVGCPESPKCIKCDKNHFCEHCLLEFCEHCETDLIDQICRTCALREQLCSECNACGDIICPHCDSNETGAILCHMKDCDGRFHTVDSMLAICCVSLCDGDFGNCSKYPVCFRHSEEEKAQRIMELGLLNCGMCNKYFCRSCLVPDNICLYCGEQDEDGNALNITCKTCCDEHRCATCNANIHHCNADQRCAQSNLHDIPRS